MRPCWLLVVGLLLSGAWAGPARAGLSPREEVDLGRRVAREIERAQPLSADAALQARLQRVGQAIAEQIRPQIYPYQFKVIASPELNAFCLPGGFIYFYEGLVALTPDDDALAYVVAHEVSHAYHRHYSEQLDKMDVTALLSGLLSLKLGVDLTGLAAAFASPSFSRQSENDADATALELMWQAGFDTAGAETVMHLFLNTEKDRPKPPRYLATHPPTDHRLGRIQAKRAELAARPRPTAEAAPIPEADLLALVGALPPLTLADNPWFPLQVGSEWTYGVQQGTGPKTSYTVTVQGRIPVPGGAVYRAQVALGKVTTSQQWLTTAGEVWTRAHAASAAAPWRLEHATEVPEGQEVEREGWRYLLVGAEALKTPCGDFPEARRIRRTRVGSDEAVEVWFVKDVGMVKRASFRTGVTEVLTRYRLAPPAATPAPPTTAPTPSTEAPAPPATTPAPPATAPAL